jgi:membrane protease YdiL (CAAX protease family)
MEHGGPQSSNRATLSNRVAVGLRGFGPLGLVAVLVILFAGNPASGVLVLLWARWSRPPWGEIGYVRPGSWVLSTAAGLVLGAAFKVVMKAVVMPLLGANPVNQSYHYLAGNRAALLGALFAVIVGAGFSEETVFRGFMFERLRKLFGRGAIAMTAIVLLTSAWFAAAHYPNQGVDGVKQAAFTGLVFGSVFAVTGRIWPLMVAHAAFDVTAVAIIYLNLESSVAHLFFK